ncbi:hypothetical protein WMY93_031851, partial [Mugilogobius chulae]
LVLMGRLTMVVPEPTADWCECDKTECSTGLKPERSGGVTTQLMTNIDRDNYLLVCVCLGCQQWQRCEEGKGKGAESELHTGSGLISEYGVIHFLLPYVCAQQQQQRSGKTTSKQPDPEIETVKPPLWFTHTMQTKFILLVSDAQMKIVLDRVFYNIGSANVIFFNIKLDLCTSALLVLSKHISLNLSFKFFGDVFSSQNNGKMSYLCCYLLYFSLNHYPNPFPKLIHYPIVIILAFHFLLRCSRQCHDAVLCQQTGQEGLFGKSDPFMVFYRSNEDGTFTICHKTEVVKNTLNPVWQPFAIPVRALCNGDYDRTIKVEVYDWDRDGSHDFIGDFTTSYRELARGQSQFNVYEVINTKKKMKKKKYVNSGTVTLLSFSVESEFTFLDYIKGGTQINFTVAIDFTASNGNPSQSTSLHYMNPYQLNAYAMALKAVGEIIQDYDSDKMFPALGFGAKLPPDGRVSHEFPLNGNMENPYCNGIEGILEAYHQSLKTVQLYGPTNFAPIVNHVARYAAAVQDGSQYFVLLIITDGVISDMAQTKEAIVNAAKLPMSIIIVGVGQAEFDAMVELDGDDIRVSSRGRLAERDIVQFVPFRDYMDRTGNHVLSMARLAKDVLAEIPDQFISYMKSRGIKPNPAPPPYTPPTGHTHHHTQI